MLRELYSNEQAMVYGGDAIQTMFNSSGSVTRTGTAGSMSWAYTGSTGRTFVDIDQNGTYDYAISSNLQVMEAILGDTTWRDASDETDMQMIASVFESPDHPSNDEDDEPIDTSHQ